jgi:hypothetical protein
MAILTSTDGARLGHSRSSAQHGELEYEAGVAPGVTVTWDPAVPDRCVNFAIPQNGDADDQLAGIAWLRLAAVMMFDRRLYLPLNRSLFDAEVAAAQFAAARTLVADEPVREALIGKALVAARRAAPGVVSYLNDFVASRRQTPAAVNAALATLAQSYAALSSEVRQYDAALHAVTEAWHGLSSRERTSARGGRAVVPPSTVGSPTGVDRIDPRLVPARVLRLGPTTDTAEIIVEATSNGELRVWVAAFRDEPTPGEFADLGVRLVDRRTGEVRGYGFLGQPRERPPLPGRYYGGVVELPDALSASDVRVDLYDLSDSAPPVRLDDAELGRVRRAPLFLANWRALVADVRLWGAKGAPAERVRAITGQLTGDASADGPLWSGGPTRANLACLAALGDRALATLLRGKQTIVVPGDDGRAAAVAAAVSGPGDLLAAELTAAYERAR